jgi:hypothetical protein
MGKAHRIFEKMNCEEHFRAKDDRDGVSFPEYRKNRGGK